MLVLSKVFGELQNSNNLAYWDMKMKGLHQSSKQIISSHGFLWEPNFGRRQNTECLQRSKALSNSASPRKLTNNSIGKVIPQHGKPLLLHSDVDFWKWLGALMLNLWFLIPFLQCNTIGLMLIWNYWGPWPTPKVYKLTPMLLQYVNGRASKETDLPLTGV